jgi:uncharacterized protein YfaT (DUF1175 family)
MQRLKDTTISFCHTDENRLMAFEGRVLRYLFGPKGKKITGDCRKLHVEEAMNLQSTLVIIKAI